MNRKGVTLLELLTVIAILGVLLSILGVSNQGYIERLRVNEATQVFSSTLENVRNEALTKSEALVLEVNDTGLMRWGSANAANGIGTELGQRQLPHSATVTVVGTDNVRFTGRGMPLTQVVYTISKRDSKRSVILLPTGAIYK